MNSQVSHVWSITDGWLACSSSVTCRPPSCFLSISTLMWCTCCCITYCRTAWGWIAPVSESWSGSSGGSRPSGRCNRRCLIWHFPHLSSPGFGQAEFQGGRDVWWRMTWLWGRLPWFRLWQPSHPMVGWWKGLLTHNTHYWYSKEKRRVYKLSKSLLSLRVRVRVMFFLSLSICTLYMWCFKVSVLFSALQLPQHTICTFCTVCRHRPSPKTIFPVGEIVSRTQTTSCCVLHGRASQAMFASAL